MSNAKTAATYLAELNGNAQDVSDWVLDLAARCDAAEAEVARMRPVVDAAVAWAEVLNAANPVEVPLADAVDAYNAASPAATKAEPSIYGPAEDACGPIVDPEHLRVNVGVVDAEQRPRSPLSDEALGEVARKAERLAVARSGEPHVDACNSMARAVREAIEASQAPAADAGAVVLAESASLGDLIAAQSAGFKMTNQDASDLVKALSHATIIDRGKLTALADGWEYMAGTRIDGAGCARELRALLT